MSLTFIFTVYSMFVDHYLTVLHIFVKYIIYSMMLCQAEHWHIYVMHIDYNIYILTVFNYVTKNLSFCIFVVTGPMSIVQLLWRLL